MEPFTLPSAGESHWALKKAVLGAFLGLGLLQGCGQPANFANASGNVALEEQDKPGSSVVKKGLVALEATPGDTSQPREKTGSQNFVSPSDILEAGHTEKSSEPSDSVGRPQPASPPEVEGEIADTPMPIAGAFLTCWTGIDPTVGDAHAGDSGDTKIGCGFLTAEGKKADVLVPIDQWRIYSISGVKVDQPIGAITASNSNLWSVEFSLPARDVAITRIAVKNAPTKVLPTDSLYLVTSLSKAKQVGGAISPNYFHVGGGLRLFLLGCPNRRNLRNQPPMGGLGVPLKIAPSSISPSSGSFAVTVSGICNVTFGPPDLKIYSVGARKVAVFSKSLKNADETVLVTLPIGNYEIALESAKFLGDKDDIGVRGLVVAPLLGDVAAGPMFALP